MRRFISRVSLLGVLIFATALTLTVNQAHATDYAWNLLPWYTLSPNDYRCGTTTNIVYNQARSYRPCQAVYDWGRGAYISWTCAYNFTSVGNIWVGYGAGCAGNGWSAPRAVEGTLVERH